MRHDPSRTASTGPPLAAALSSQLYLVVFRSVRRPEADLVLLREHDDRAYEEALQAGGLLRYFKGHANERGECLSFLPLGDARAGQTGRRCRLAPLSRRRQRADVPLILARTLLDTEARREASLRPYLVRCTEVPPTANRAQAKSETKAKSEGALYDRAGNGRPSGIIGVVRVYLIDGYSLLYRAFYALPQSISTSSGLPTNALYGFTSMLLKLLDTEEEVGLGVVWDGGMPAFRLEVFPEYKAQRSAMPEELRVQLDHMDEILEAMNIPAIRAEGFEADDALATMSRQVPEGVELFIVTGDQDAMQLVDGKVKVLRTTRGVSETKTYGRDEVVEEYGVTPEQIPDYKALTGDSSDNIPGVRGIGPKGAANLLKEFGTLDGVYENLENISAKGTRKKLEEGRESAFMSLELAKMRFDVPVRFDPEKLHFEGVSPEIRDITRRYEFRTLESRLTELPVAGGERLPPLERLEVSVSEDPVELSFEPVAASPLGDESGRWCVAVSADEVRVADSLPDIPVKVHDSKRLGVRRADFDTYLAAYLVKPGLGSYELETLAAERGMAEVEVGHEDRMVAEAARSAALVYALSPRLEEELEAMGLARLYYDVELPLAGVLEEIEETGMPVDATTLEEVGEELEGRISNVEQHIYEDVGHPFNIGSPKQLGEVLFEEMGLPPVRKTKPATPPTPKSCSSSP